MKSEKTMNNVKQIQNNIQVSNVLKATELLLGMDISAIDERYKKDVNAWIVALKQALARFTAKQISLHQNNEPEKTEERNVEIVAFIQTDEPYQESLRSLVHAAQALIPLLTLEAKESFQQTLMAWEANRNVRTHPANTD